MFLTWNPAYACVSKFQIIRNRFICITFTCGIRLRSGVRDLRLRRKIKFNVRSFGVHVKRAFDSVCFLPVMYVTFTNTLSDIIRPRSEYKTSAFFFFC